MSQNELPDVLPEELAALDELARLLEQYQTYLITGHGFAESVRAQAGNASGTARPALERLHPKGAAGVTQVEAALRLLKTEDDRKTVLEDLEPALKDLRAMIASAKWRKTTERPQLAAGHGGAGPITPSQAAQTPSRSRTWIWVGGGLLVGLVLGAFGTNLSQSASALSRVWRMLEPVIAAGSGGVLGNLLFQSNATDFRQTVRTHWVTLAVCSVLLMSTVPTAVEAARELLGIGASRSSAPAQADGGNASSQQPGAPASPAPQQPSSSSSNTTPAPSSDAPVPGPSAQHTPAKAAGGAGGVPAATQERATSGAGPASSTALSAECSRLLARVTLGEEDTFSASEQARWKQCSK